MEKNEANRHIKYWIALSLCFLIAVLGGVFYISSRKPDDIQKHTATWTDLGFDTPISFQATCTDAEFEEYSKLVQSLYLGYNALFDQYNPYEGINNVYILNQEAATHPVEVESALIDCIKLGIESGQLNSKLDIAQGKLLSLWHDAREASKPYLPGDDEIKAALMPNGEDGIEIDEENSTIYFTDPQIQLDLGAIAKGYTTQIVAEQLEAAGLKSGYINAGGNVVLIGKKPDGKDWVIGIQNPSSSSSIVQFSTKKPVAIVTSGDYQRYMEVGGQQYSHIIDPGTGYPPKYMHSVSVISEDSGFADAMSTALFCTSVEDGMKFASQNGLECIWIVDKGETVKGFSPQFTTKTYDIYVTGSIQDQVTLTNS